MLLTDQKDFFVDTEADSIHLALSLANVQDKS